MIGPLGATMTITTWQFIEGIWQPLWPVFVIGFIGVALIIKDIIYHVHTKTHHLHLHKQEPPYELWEDGSPGITLDG